MKTNMEASRLAWSGLTGRLARTGKIEKGTRRRNTRGPGCRQEQGCAHWRNVHSTWSVRDRGNVPRGTFPSCLTVPPKSKCLRLKLLGS